LVLFPVQGKGDPSLITDADVDGDGVVDINDLNSVRTRIGLKL
jgi:hypothetical protein